VERVFDVVSMRGWGVEIKEKDGVENQVDKGNGR
jgi:hypothetical protein